MLGGEPAIMPRSWAAPVPGSDGRLSSGEAENAAAGSAILVLAPRRWCKAKVSSIASDVLLADGPARSAHWVQDR